MYVLLLCRANIKSFSSLLHLLRGKRREVCEGRQRKTDIQVLHPILLHSTVNDNKLIFPLAKGIVRIARDSRNLKKNDTSNNKRTNRITLFRIIAKNNCYCCDACFSFSLLEARLTGMCTVCRVFKLDRLLIYPTSHNMKRIRF